MQDADGKEHAVEKGRRSAEEGRLSSQYRHSWDQGLPDASADAGAKAQWKQAKRIRKQQKKTVAKFLYKRSFAHWKQWDAEYIGRQKRAKEEK